MEEQLIYIIMFVSIALSALCSMLEATLLSTPLSYITGLEEQGIKGAQRLKSLKQNSDRPISAILCLNTILLIIQNVPANTKNINTPAIAPLIRLVTI